MTNEDTEQYRHFLRNLQREEHRPDALNGIKNLFAFKPAGEALTTIRDAGISKIVQCLNVSNKYVHLLSIINLLFLAILLVYITSQSSSYIYVKNHNNPLPREGRTNQQKHFLL